MYVDITSNNIRSSHWLSDDRTIEISGQASGRVMVTTISKLNGCDSFLHLPEGRLSVEAGVQADTAAAREEAELAQLEKQS